MNIETVNELIASLESAGELSIKERKYLDVMRWAIRVAGERDAALNAERIWEKTMMEACGEDGPASVASEIRSLRALRDTAIQALKSQVEQLAAENVALKKFCKNAAFDADYEAELGMERGGFTDALNNIETTATDRIVAGIKADGVEMFALMFAEEAIKDNNITTGWKARASRAASEYAELLREGADK